MKQTDPRHINIKLIIDYIKFWNLEHDGLEEFLNNIEQFPDDEILDTRLRGYVKHARSLRKHFKIHLNRLAKEIGVDKPYES